jgi:hypothetical protein
MLRPSCEFRILGPKPKDESVTGIVAAIRERRV